MSSAATFDLVALEEKLDLIADARRRRSVIEYACAINPDYERTWYAEVIGEHLDAVVRGDILRVAISMPPQHGKSELVSRLWPSQVLGFKPNTRLMMASYGDDLAAFNANEVRRYMNTPEYQTMFPGIELSQARDRDGKRNTADLFQVRGRGYSGMMKSGGIFGGLTGFPYDIGVADDLIPKMSDAMSVVYMRKLIREWNAVFRARQRTSKAAIVVMFTRWVLQDLIGHILELAEKTGEKWTVLNFPAIKDRQIDSDPRALGEALWPSRKPIHWLENERSSLDPLTWAAQWQGQPIDDIASFFPIQNWQIYKEHELPKRFQTGVISVDAAFKKEGHSWTVFQAWGRAGGHNYLIDQFREHIDYADMEAAFESFCMRFPWIYTKVIEEAALGHALIQKMQRKMRGITASPPNENKRERAAQWQRVPREGRIHIPDPDKYPWVPRWISEHYHFKGLDKDEENDQVDASGHANIWLEANDPSWLS